MGKKIREREENCKEFQKVNIEVLAKSETKRRTRSRGII